MPWQFNVVSCSSSSTRMSALHHEFWTFCEHVLFLRPTFGCGTTQPRALCICKTYPLVQSSHTILATPPIDRATRVAFCLSSFESKLASDAALLVWTAFEPKYYMSLPLCRSNVGLRKTHTCAKDQVAEAAVAHGKCGSCSAAPVFSVGYHINPHRAPSLHTTY